ncbi:uncharacterized protein GIQ15_03507 [Arthroderma uncinatum]|uniref:uncharacterized protein n=1 Tax=Arthroderma uncinatum TaxID=74035 RepID=UPI00144A5D5F|nr:uncharacterized protein GIQ15_03507 [Arthroderma uncinatum]KAF3484183.1 hypothetical protein GIQ15_03507 [Arthroderma uncinatum]
MRAGRTAREPKTLQTLATATETETAEAQDCENGWPIEKSVRESARLCYCVLIAPLLVVRIPACDLARPSRSPRASLLGQKQRPCRPDQPWLAGSRGACTAPTRHSPPPPLRRIQETKTERDREGETDGETELITAEGVFSRGSRRSYRSRERKDNGQRRRILPTLLFFPGGSIDTSLSSDLSHP